MIKKDFCQNSVFLNQTQKDQLNNQLNNYFEEISSKFIQSNIPANVYLSGSLARQEPSVIIEFGKQRLFSDIDLVISLSYANIVPTKLRWLSKFKKSLKSSYPDYDISVSFIDLNKLKHVKSCFGRDILCSAINPIYEGSPLRELVITSPQRVGFLENLVHQMGIYYLNLAATSLELQYHHIKLILECLRVQLNEIEENLIGFYSVYEKRFSPQVAKILSPNMIEELVKARELFGSFPVPNVNITKIIKKSIKNYFKINDNNAENNDILEALYSKQRQSSDLLNSFQLALLTFVIGLSIQDTSQKKWFQFFKEILINMDKQKITCVDQLFVLFDYTWTGSVVFKSKESDLIIEILTKLREDYLRELHLYHYGERV